ncbi:MAG TPA: peptidase S10 [Acidobacteriota bacterium]|nr:peptidase S10 [Acidobacteriota bacterium]
MAEGGKELEERTNTTRHSVTIGGQVIDYQATAGTLLLKEEDGTPKAEVFFIAYVKEGVDDSASRPVTFTFNGGPGSSSVWLHLGGVGPKRVRMDEDGFMLPPPGGLADNPYSWLDLSDLVFIDPVSTGFSRAPDDEKAKDFHGLREDISSVGEFIRLYCVRYGRWNSPKFLAGESYGTTRAAGLSSYLQQQFGMYLNGIVLVSSILNFQTVDFNVGNDLPYLLHFPTYTATAWYHRQLAPALQDLSLREVLDRSEEFALGAYASALLRGDRLSGSERDAIAQSVAGLTGLTAEFVLQNDLRLPLGRFTKELLRDQARTVGRLDSRFKGIDRDSGGERYEYDPSYAAIEGPFSAALKHYVRQELGYPSDLPYEILTGRVRPWNFSEFENSYVDVGEDLRRAMTQNPYLRVFVANGYYDFATPYFATEYTFSHLGLDPQLRPNVEMGYYESGHMMYIHQPSLRQLKSDVAGFYAKALP